MPTNQFVQDIPPSGEGDEKPVLTSSPKDDVDFQNYLDRSQSILSDENTERQRIEKENKITPPEPTLQKLDPHIDFGTNPLAKVPQTPETVVAPEKTNSTEKEILDLLGLNTQPNGKQEQQTQQQPPNQGGLFNQEQVNAMIADALTKSEEKWLNAKTTLDEIEKDPYRFAAQYMPHLFPNFNIEAYVNSKLQEEFGVDFNPDPNELMIFNSQSNKYLRRQMELQSEASNLNNTASDSIKKSEAESARVASETEDKVRQSLMKKFGFSSVEDFNKDYFGPLKNLTGEQVWETLIRYKMLQSKYSSLKRDVNQPAPRGFETPGVISINSSPEPAGSDVVNELSQFFSPERFTSKQH